MTLHELRRSARHDRLWRIAAAFSIGWAACLPVRGADGATIDLRFRDLFEAPIGPRGLVISDKLRAADGHTVRITGYMVAQEDPVPGRFFLTPLPVSMSEHADGEADDLPPSTVVVVMPPAERDLALPHTRGLLALTGTLRVGREEMPDGRVAWVRLELDPRPGR
jgi:hypothetical protein